MAPGGTKMLAGARGRGRGLGLGSHLVLLEGDLPNLAVAHKGAGHLEHTLTHPHPDDVVGGEVANLLANLALDKIQGAGGGAQSLAGAVGRE